ncbi:MAG: asparagine synthase-related protein, partial [Bacteroidales bacterium]|nr:asparagine synthase-related protein [Bacteroidales bacterium]
MSWFYSQNFDESLPMPKRFQMLDLNTFLPELVLTKVDRASMANSLEVRVPFLENKITDFMLCLNPETYFDKSQQKKILYKILKKTLPKTILNRKKQGFVGPNEYYNNINYYENILQNSVLVKNNIFNNDYIQSLLNSQDYWRLWKISVFELWFQKWMN